MHVKRLRAVVGWTIGIVTLIAAAYVALLAHPELLFDRHLVHGDFVLYSRTDPGVETAAVLDTAQRRLVASPLYKPSPRRVFVTGSARWYAFFTGPGRRAMAKNFELGNSIYLPALDAAGSHIVHFDGRRANLAPVLVHEAAHTDLQRHVGLFRLWRLPFWKKEGYPEMVAYGDTMPVLMMGDLLAGTDRAVPRQRDMVVPRRYVEAEVAWRFLIGSRHLKIDDVLATTLTLPEIIRAVMESGASRPS